MILSIAVPWFANLIRSTTLGKMTAFVFVLGKWPWSCWSLMCTSWMEAKFCPAHRCIETVLVDCMQTLHHLHEALGYPQILISAVAFGRTMFQILKDNCTKPGNTDHGGQNPDYQMNRVLLIWNTCVKNHQVFQELPKPRNLIGSSLKVVLYCLKAKTLPLRLSVSVQFAVLLISWTPQS